MFSVELKKLREQLGISQQKLAERLGVSQATVGMWECGKRDPSFATLQAICDFFGVSADFLLGRPSPDARPSALAPADSELLYKFHALDQQAQARILNSLDFEYRAIKKEGASSYSSLA